MWRPTRNSTAGGGVPLDLLCTKPRSRLTCFTSVLIFRPSGLVHVNDSAQEKGIVSMNACDHSRPKLYLGLESVVIFTVSSPCSDPSSGAWPDHSAVYIWLYNPCLDLGRFFSFLIYTQSVGLLERGISPSQGRYLHRTTQTQNKRTQTPIPRVGFEPKIHCSSGRRRFMP
jgi:hypothetical protein